MPRAEFITGGLASGKTTKGLKKLAKAGGGIFFTRNLRHTIGIVRKLSETGVDMSKVQLFEVTGRIVVDDADDHSTILITYLPYGDKTNG